MRRRDAAGVFWFATKGSNTNEAARMEALLSSLNGVEELPFDKRRKCASFFGLLATLRRRRPCLLVMEGTGLAGGFMCLVAKCLWRVSYIFSSGDAVGPFIAVHAPIAGPAAAFYERLLCRWSAGFIGWTPYLCGRALTFGAPRAITVPGWVLGARAEIDRDTVAAELRTRWGIPPRVIVVGLLGALEWNEHRQYCYGLELVRCAQRLQRRDIAFLIIGEGSGLRRLRAEAGTLLGSQVFLPGSVSLNQVIPALTVMDVASLPQSMDGVGLFRYTTKLSEYVEARLPVITLRIPVAYDLGGDWMWRLPGFGPWEDCFIQALTELIERLDRAEITRRKQTIPQALADFQREPQILRVTRFIEEILEEQNVGF